MALRSSISSRFLSAAIFEDRDPREHADMITLCPRPTKRKKSARTWDRSGEFFWLSSDCLRAMESYFSTCSYQQGLRGIFLRFTRFSP